jgi:3-deoxy-7-phosphoheptulonate synthase
MIVHLKENIQEMEAVKLAEATRAVFYEKEGRYIFITPSADQELPAVLEGLADAYFPMDSDIQLASKKYRSELREIQVGGNVKLGGNHQNTLLITGPCSIESKEQITQSAELLKALNITTLRAGCFKPRTSPYSFQGLGMEGLLMLAAVREQYGLNIITEVRDATHVDAVIEHADIVQVGSKAMYDHGILKSCGKARKPILLKRHFGATLQEFVQAAEFILSAGNEQVMLCERGIRTFETKTRFSLDLCGVAYLKEHTNLPVVLDPSHAMGIAYGIPDLTRACVAMGVDGLLIETHPTPKVAKSDAAQQLNHDEFREMYRTLQPIAEAVGRKIV